MEAHTPVFTPLMWEAGGSGIQDHLWLHNELEVSRDCMRHDPIFHKKVSKGTKKHVKR